MTYSLMVPDKLLELVPNSVDDNDELNTYLLTSLEVGLTALKQANITADTSIVSTKFTEISENMKNQFIGENSDLSNSINRLFKEADSPFRKALDPDNPDSPIHKFLKNQNNEQKSHKNEISDLIKGLKSELVKELYSIKEDLNIKEKVLEERLKGAAKGRDFEEEVLDDLNKWQKYSDEFIDTSTLAEGTLKRKVGDILGKTDEGVKIVFEVKSGKDYRNTGDKSLDKQMNEAMDYRKAQGAISVTTVDAMNEKNWQSSIFLDRGGNKLIVAVDRETQDFTIVRLAYVLLRERLISNLDVKKIDLNSILPEDIEPIINDLSQNMAVFATLKRTVTDIKGRFEGLSKEINKLEDNITKRSRELKLLLI